jgi:hypothetical protein
MIRPELKNLDLEKRQSFLTEFALTNLNQLILEPDSGRTQTLNHQFEMKPRPSHVEPAATHKCLIAFEVPNEFLLGMIILVATENRLWTNWRPASPSTRKAWPTKSSSSPNCSMAQPSRKW